jgi:hypothetical protein
MYKKLRLIASRVFRMGLGGRLSIDCLLHQ